LLVAGEFMFDSSAMPRWLGWSGIAAGTLASVEAAAAPEPSTCLG
jgi:hypothetical protein